MSLQRATIAAALSKTVPVYGPSTPWSTTGSIGIGTTTPGAALEIGVTDDVRLRRRIYTNIAVNSARLG